MSPETVLGLSFGGILGILAIAVAVLTIIEKVKNIKKPNSVPPQAPSQTHQAPPPRQILGSLPEGEGAWRIVRGTELDTLRFEMNSRFDVVVAELERINKRLFGDN